MGSGAGNRKREAPQRKGFPYKLVKTRTAMPPPTQGGRGSRCKRTGPGCPRTAFRGSLRAGMQRRRRIKRNGKRSGPTALSGDSLGTSRRHRSASMNTCSLLPVLRIVCSLSISFSFFCLFNLISVSTQKTWSVSRIKGGVCATTRRAFFAGGFLYGRKLWGFGRHPCDRSCALGPGIAKVRKSRKRHFSAAQH